MSSKSVVIAEVSPEETHQVSVVQDNDRVERTSTNAADDLFTIGLLPGTLGRDLDFFNTHVIHPILE